MKNLSILFILLSSVSWSASVSSEEITNMISEIKEERVGISLSELEKTANPFLIVKKEDVVEKIAGKAVKKMTEEIVYELHAILNHAAFINKKWYKKGDKLGLYRVAYIGSKSVNITSKSGNKTLSIKKKKKKFIKLNQGRK